MTEGTIIKWHKKEGIILFSNNISKVVSKRIWKIYSKGDKIASGDILFEVQTDKAVVPFEMEEEGIMAKIIVNNKLNFREGLNDGIRIGLIFQILSKNNFELENFIWVYL